MNSPEALDLVELSRKISSDSESVEELREMNERLCKLVESCLEAIMYYQIVEMLLFDKTGVSVSSDDVEEALTVMLNSPTEDSE